MAKVQISDVKILDPNPSTDFFAPFRFEITVDCHENLLDDLEFTLTYVGSADSNDYDQILDSVDVGPMAEGRQRFTFETDAPDPKKIPAQEAIGVTVLLLSCSYRKQVFVKIGYFVKTYYPDPEMVEDSPTIPQFEKIHREIVVDEPRITRYMIKWDEEEEKENQQHEMNGDNSVHENGTIHD